MTLESGMVFKTKNGTRFVIDQTDPNDGGTWRIRHMISDNDYIATTTFFRGSALEKYIVDNNFELDITETKKRIFKKSLDGI